MPASHKIIGNPAEWNGIWRFYLASKNGGKKMALYVASMKIVLWSNTLATSKLFSGTQHLE